MKINIKILRWIFLVLYVAIIIGLLGMAYSGKSQLLFYEELNGKLFWTIFVLGITLISQILFIFTAGTVNLCQPIRRKRLIFPVIIASLMISVLVLSLFTALRELLINKTEFPDNFWLIIFGLNWIGWSIVFLISYKNIERYKTLKNLINILIGGSLIELLVTIPSHIIVAKRPGCFVGMGTAFGITGGISVMLWAFGPGIILLFLQQKYKAELNSKEEKGTLQI